jgi:predicted RecA/RadA family phage recombinase
MAEPDPVDTAWRIHALQVDWTGKVDSKASFALAIESAILLAIISLAGGGRRLSGLTGFWINTFFWSGVVVLVGSLLCVALVVRPRLRSPKVYGERLSNFIYFGHLKDWDPDRLQEALSKEDVLPMLSRQLINMAKIAWLKHRLLQVSMTGTTIGAALVAVAAALND